MPPIKHHKLLKLKRLGAGGYALTPRELSTAALRGSIGSRGRRRRGAPSTRHVSSRSLHAACQDRHESMVSRAHLPHPPPCFSLPCSLGHGGQSHQVREQGGPKPNHHPQIIRVVAHLRTLVTPKGALGTLRGATPANFRSNSRTL